MSGNIGQIEQKTTLPRVNNKSAEAVTAATIALLTPYKSLVSTITSDNGKEFAQHEKIAKSLGCYFYFAHFSCSWGRGLHEDTNGLLRQDFPKNTDFKAINDTEVTRVVAKLNNRPRKTLSFRTSADLMAKKLAALAA